MLSDRATRAGVAACAGKTNPANNTAEIQRRIAKKVFMASGSLFQNVFLLDFDEGISCEQFW
jgi:hypothetical protein